VERWKVGVAVALVAAFALLGSYPTALAVPPASTGASSAPTHSVPPGSPAPVRPPPPLICPIGYPGYYALSGGVYPLDPNFNYQGSCHFAAADEVHASFASGAAGSAERWRIPWTLPNQTAAGQQNISDGVYVGMVVSGDPNSTWNQSYLEVLASPIVTPPNRLTWNVQVAVLSLSNETTFHPVGCAPGTTYNLSWNDSYYCEYIDFASEHGISMLSGLSGGTALAVTFDGNTTADTGMDVWVNETDGNLTSSQTTLNFTTTGTYAFEPAYPSACAATCSLDWGQSYGLGVGINICPFSGLVSAACDSYNGSAYATLPPVAWGSPEYWNDTTLTYSNDYRYLQPESASGVCDTSPPAGVTTANCFEFTSNGGTGFYPYFSLTATGLDFGRTYAASATTYGGAYGQYLDTPGTQDLSPLVETDLVDSGLSGYVAPGGSVNVSLNVTDLGAISSTSLAWSLNGSAWTTQILSGTGTPSAQSYVGTIPSGANGVLRYQVNTTNAAGDFVSSSIRSVLRGPLPSFDLGITILPPGCGTVSVGGQAYGNGSTAIVGPGPVPISASGCYPYNFTVWQTTGGVSAVDPHARLTSLVVAAAGNLSGEFTYIRPLEALTVHVTPTGCGEVVVDGLSYSDGASVPLLYGLSHNLSANVTCAGYAFGGWTPGPNVTVLGPSLVVLNNGTLTLTVVPVSDTSPVTFATNPFTCGGVGLGGAGYTSGESVHLAPGAYPLTPDPCAHYGFVNFTTVSPDLSLTGTTLTVAGNGTVLENNFHLTEAYVSTDPAECGGVLLDGVSYANGVYIPLENHSAYTVTGFSCAGHYLDAFSATGGLTLAGSLLTVNGSGTLLAVSLAGAASIFVGFVTTPAACGGVELNGTVYKDGAFVSLTPDEALAISALPCVNYGFVGWSFTPGSIAIVGSTVYLNGSGEITAIFGALVPILFETLPATCGAILVGGTAYADGSSAILINGRNYTIAPAPCAHYELELFESSPYVAIQNNSLAPDGPSTITAVYVPVPYTIVTAVGGAGCGTVTLDGSPAGSGVLFNLTAGSYLLSETPCVTSTFGGFDLSSNLSYASGHLFVNGSGTLSSSFFPILPSVSIGGDGGSYVGGTALFYAAVLVPLASSGYSYLWNFGDGSTNTTGSNLTTHVFESTGTFTVTVEVTDPYHHTANASLQITVVGQPTTNYGGTLTTGLIVLGIAAVVLVAVALFARTRRPPPAPDAAGSAEPTSADEPPAPVG
jgi:hypothetical protein